MASCCGLRLPILVTEATVTGTLVTPSLPPHCHWPLIGGAGWAQQLRSGRCSSAPLGGCGITDTGEAAAPGPASLQW